MNKGKKAQDSPVKVKPESRQKSYKHPHVEVGKLESYILLVLCIATLEAGFIYTSLFVLTLMTVAFAEMMQL